VAADVTRNFTAAHRVTDKDRVLQIKLFDQFREVIGEMYYIRSHPKVGLETPVPATVMGDAAKTARTPGRPSGLPRHPRSTASRG